MRRCCVWGSGWSGWRSRGGWRGSGWAMCLMGGARVRGRWRRLRIWRLGIKYEGVVKMKEKMRWMNRFGQWKGRIYIHDLKSRLGGKRRASFITVDRFKNVISIHLHRIAYSFLDLTFGGRGSCRGHRHFVACFSRTARDVPASPKRGPTEESGSVSTADALNAPRGESCTARIVRSHPLRLNV